MHAIRKESNTMTKLRAVFDTSAKSSTGVSLNDTLLVGPTIHPPLVNILLRFRSNRIALTTDVSQMYRAVELIVPDCNLYRFVWRSSSEEEFLNYWMTWWFLPLEVELQQPNCAGADPPRSTYTTPSLLMVSPNSIAPLRRLVWSGMSHQSRSGGKPTSLLSKGYRSPALSSVVHSSSQNSSGLFLTCPCLRSLPGPTALSSWAGQVATYGDSRHLLATECLQSLIVSHPQEEILGFGVPSNPQSLQCGDIMLLKEDMAISAKWPLGRVIQVHSGTDNLVHVATIWTPKGWPVTKLTILVPHDQAGTWL